MPPQDRNNLGKLPILKLIICSGLNMPHRASTSVADAATVNDPLRQIQMRAGRVAKRAGIRARRAGSILRDDATRLVKGAGKALIKGGQAMMACSGAGTSLER